MALHRLRGGTKVVNAVANWATSIEPQIELHPERRRRRSGLGRELGGDLGTAAGDRHQGLRACVTRAGEPQEHTRSKRENESQRTAPGRPRRLLIAHLQNLLGATDLT
jgi:hypothetical protein